MDNIDFQIDTAERIEEIFDNAVRKGGKQRRVLLADEVGLGKTIIAREVISRVRKIRSDVGDDMYRVIYVCSNLTIANQNVGKLGLNDSLNVSESRLSMQYLVLQEKIKQLKDDGEYGEGKMPELLIPLTPGTSFNTSNCGNIEERALIYCIVKDMPEFESVNKDFFKYLDRIKEVSWSYAIKKYQTRIKKLGSENFKENVQAAIRKDILFNDVCKLLKDAKKNKIEIISKLRIIFAKYSLNLLEPDLVVLDEFQRFSGFLNGEDNDENLIADKFFGNCEDGNSDPLILLMSATPYKPFSTLEEINELRCDEHFSDFMTLMNFLFKKSGQDDFKTTWQEYSKNLSSFAVVDTADLLASKKLAEEKMYQAICRTERIADGLIRSDEKTIDVMEGDVQSFLQMQRLLSNCKEIAQRSNKFKFRSFKAPVDYVKSSPYILSFMENSYVLKQNLSGVYAKQLRGKRKLPLPRKHILLLPKNDLETYKEIPSNNARLEELKKNLFDGDKHPEDLLWVPASHPYYTFSENNVFTENKDFSKILIFSAWGLVPRMLASLLSYESERLTVATVDKTRRYTKRWSFPISSEDNWLNTTCVKLAKYYEPQSYLGKNVHDIIEDISKEIIADFKCTDESKFTSTDLCKYMMYLDGKPDGVDGLPINAIQTLAKLAIASPANCFYRIFTKEGFSEKDACLLANEYAKNIFKKLFNHRCSAAVLDLIFKSSGKHYYEKVLDYCLIGNLQSTLDEYVHMLKLDCGALTERTCNKKFDRNKVSINREFDYRLGASVCDDTPIKVDTKASFGERADNKKFTIKTHFALNYGIESKTDEGDVAHANDLRIAFNSPFKPFVLASTSIGQEGLDFHWFCRKIVHWNIPANAQDIEQRDGRINRFQCLAVRRNVARLYPEKFSWDEMFKAARAELENMYSDMVPYWCLPKGFIENKGVKPEMIERIMYLFPHSIDQDKRKRMKDILLLYRLTLGQPDQEKLLGALAEKGVDESLMKDLLFDLSPNSRKRKGNHPTGIDLGKC